MFIINDAKKELCESINGIVSVIKPFYDLETLKDSRYTLYAYVEITDNNLYVKLGFTLDSIERPDYRYTKGHGERLHKFGFRKQLLHKKYNLPLTMTENEMTKELGYYKIWDCGLIKYIWRNNNGIA